MKPLSRISIGNRHHRAATGLPHAPFALVHFHRRYAQELLHGLLRVVYLDLLRIVVFVLDADIARFVFVGILVFKVITGGCQLGLAKAE